MNENEDNKKLDWMYKGTNSLVNREEYLLGKPVDKALEQVNQEERDKKLGIVPPKNHVEHECIPPSIRDFNKILQVDQVDLSAKLQEDPLVAIRKREEEARRQFLQNPIQLKKLQEALQQQDLKKKKKKKKKSKRDDSDSDLDNQIVNKLKALKGNTIASGLTKEKKRKDKNDSLDIILMHKYNELKDKLSQKDMDDILAGRTSSSESDDNSNENKGSSSDSENGKSKRKKIIKEDTRRKHKGDKYSTIVKNNSGNEIKYKENDYRSRNTDRRHNRRDSSCENDGKQSKRTLSQNKKKNYDGGKKEKTKYDSGSSEDLEYTRHRHKQNKKDIEEDTRNRRKEIRRNSSEEDTYKFKGRSDKYESGQNKRGSSSKTQNERSKRERRNDDSDSSENEETNNNKHLSSDDENYRRRRREKRIKKYTKPNRKETRRNSSGDENYKSKRIKSKYDSDHNVKGSSSKSFGSRKHKKIKSETDSSDSDSNSSDSDSSDTSTEKKKFHDSKEKIESSRKEVRKKDGKNSSNHNKRAMKTNSSDSESEDKNKKRKSTKNRAQNNSNYAKQKAESSQETDLDKIILQKLRMLRNEADSKEKVDEDKPEEKVYTHYSSDEDAPVHKKKSFGLVRADGTKIELKGNPQPIKNVESKKIEPPKIPEKKKPNKLSEEQKEELRRQMMKDAESREKDRSENLRKYREEDETEENERKTKDFDKNFIHKELSKSTKGASIESRIRSNLNNIQRSSRDMSSNFSKKH